MQSMTYKIDREVTNKKFEDKLEMDDKRIENFIKSNLKTLYVSEKPKKQQLYILFKLIMSRRKFEMSWKDSVMPNFYKALMCCRSKCLKKRF